MILAFMQIDQKAIDSLLSYTQNQLNLSKNEHLPFSQLSHVSVKVLQK